MLAGLGVEPTPAKLDYDQHQWGFQIAANAGDALINFAVKQNYRTLHEANGSLCWLVHFGFCS